MDYPLGAAVRHGKTGAKGVLIPILMDYPLGAFLFYHDTSIFFGLNPYSNGLPEMV